MMLRRIPVPLRLIPSYRTFGVWLLTRLKEVRSIEQNMNSKHNHPMGRKDKLHNRLSKPALPTVPCILGPFKVHHALCDCGASRNILPKMVYNCLDEDPLVPTSQRLQLVVSTVVQPYGIANNVLAEFHDSSSLVDLMVMDMDPRQQTSIILGKPFLKSVRATNDKTRGMINMKVDGVHEKFIYHLKNFECCFQIRVH
jgi:hypothetical protein